MWPCTSQIPPLLGMLLGTSQRRTACAGMWYASCWCALHLSGQGTAQRRRSCVTRWGCPQRLWLRLWLCGRSTRATSTQRAQRSWLQGSGNRPMGCWCCMWPPASCSARDTTAWRPYSTTWPPTPPSCPTGTLEVASTCTSCPPCLHCPPCTNTTSSSSSHNCSTGCSSCQSPWLPRLPPCPCTRTPGRTLPASQRPLPPVVMLEGAPMLGCHLMPSSSGWCWGRWRAASSPHCCMWRTARPARMRQVLALKRA
mmetsp:Transcript_10648/g.29151  ORF Transcript_10648/g.29151 Transcript_10648/m.29151 type:complete len:254 (+) Transcript_10648:1509-2270(+)